jgi:hypothetical protein
VLSIFVMRMDGENVDIAAKEGAAVIVDDRYHQNG